MFKKLLRRSSAFQWCSAVAVCCLIYGEILCYYFARLSWPDVGGHVGSTKGITDEYMRVLLVADPQIIGYQSEPPFVGVFARFDNDRYLLKTFVQAYNYVQPDVIIFLGDLMDEGSIAKTDQEYGDNVERFYKIFSTPGTVKRIFLSGDNDVGGENRDYKTPAKIKRFEKHFNELSGVDVMQFINFVRVNYDIQDEFKGAVKKSIEKLAKKLSHDNRLTVLLNHHSILNRWKYQIYPVLKTLSPSLVISAHTHKGALYLCSDCDNLKKDPMSWSGKAVPLNTSSSKIHLNLRKLGIIQEIAVPTCSYRMGTKDMAYGVLLINKAGDAEYSILWSTQRYPILFLYVFLLVCLLLSSCCRRCMKCP